MFDITAFMVIQGFMIINHCNLVAILRKEYMKNVPKFDSLFFRIFKGKVNIRRPV